MVRHPATGWETTSMATTEQTLREDLQNAIRTRDEVRLATLRMLVAAVQKEQVGGGDGPPPARRGGASGRAPPRGQEAPGGGHGVRGSRSAGPRRAGARRARGR